MLERTRRQQMPGKVVLVEPLLNDDDAAALLVIEPRDQGLLIKVLAALAFGRRDRIHRLQQVVDDDQIGAMASHRAAQRYGFPKAGLCRELFLVPIASDLNTHV